MTTDIRPEFDPQSTRAIVRWAENAGGSWSDPTRWTGGAVPTTGDAAYIYQQGPFSTLYGFNSPSWNSTRVDGAIGAVVVNHGSGRLTTNEFAVGIYGETPGQGGVYRLSGGTLQAGAGYVGAAGVGTFDQVGGHAIFGSFLSIAENPSTVSGQLPVHGKYEIGGGSMSAGEINVGYNSDGTLNLFGGQVTVGTAYTVGHFDSAQGTVEMIGGSIISRQAYIGFMGGAGTFTQYGGSVMALDWFDLGENAGSGHYELHGGTITTGELVVGLGDGAGFMLQTAGVANVGYLYVGPFGTAKFHGGTLSAATIEFDGPVDVGSHGFSLTQDIQNAIRIESLEGDLTAQGAVGYDATRVLATVAGDVNLDRTTNIADFSIVGSNFNQPGYWTQGDVNYDGSVNIGDFSIVASNFNQSYPAARVPESGWLVLGGAVIALRRRRDGSDFIPAADSTRLAKHGCEFRADDSGGFKSVQVGVVPDFMPFVDIGWGEIGHRSFPFVAGAAIVTHDDRFGFFYRGIGDSLDTIESLPISHDVVSPVVMLEADIADPNFREGDGGHVGTVPKNHQKRNITWP